MPTATKVVTDNPGLQLTITDCQQLTPRIRSYRLRATHAGELPLVTAGSHLPITVTLADGRHALHQYSLCSNPTQRDEYQIAVLLETNGHGGSQWIHEHFSVGMTLACGQPINNFHLHADASPAVLIAGGIGISPLLAMAHTLSARGRRFVLHYAGRSKIEMAFATELATLFPRQTHFYAANEHQRLDLMHIMGDAPSNAMFYLCGPQTLLAESEICARMLGIASDRIQREHFASETQPGEQPVILELVRSNRLIQASADQSLLSAVRDAGIAINFDCCVGDCGCCATQILAGEAEHRDHVLSDAAKAKGMICLCVSRAKTEKLVLDL